MSDIAMILGKAVVALFLSLLIQYTYIAWVSRLRKPSERDILKHLEITWQVGGFYRRKNHPELRVVEDVVNKMIIGKGREKKKKRKKKNKKSKKKK